MMGEEGGAITRTAGHITAGGAGLETVSTWVREREGRGRFKDVTVNRSLTISEGAAERRHGGGCGGVSGV